MDVSSASTSSTASNLRSSTTAGEMQRAELKKTDHASRLHDHHYRDRHDHKHRPDRALGVFRQELQLFLKARFHAKFATAQQDYAQNQSPATSDDIAAETLGAARQVIAESPTTAARSLISFKSRVHETASFVRETLGAPQDTDGIDGAVAAIDKGITGLEGEVANNRESPASVLAIDTRSKQQATIRIRTHEGDIVRLSLKQVDRLSVTETASSTEAEVSSRSRLKLRIEGDLNESERAAIEKVFAQAEKIADEFFGGDIGAAFNFAGGFEFDAQQLARVNMRFKLHQMTHVAYTESVSAPSLAAVKEPAVVEPGPVAASVAEAKPVIQPPVTDEAPATAPAEKPTAAPAGEASAQIAADNAGFSSLFDVLGRFLRSVGEGFEAGSASGSFRYHYSESFKLDLLKTVIHAVIPEDPNEAAVEVADA